MRNIILSLTLSRIIFGPLILILMIFTSYGQICFVLFILAALTDFFDGYLARRYNHESRLGAILDPIGDKILLVFSIITVIYISSDPFITTFSAIILGREFWVSALREYSSEINKSLQTSVSFLAKLKTTFQFISIAMFFFSFSYGSSMVQFLATFVLFIATLLSLKTGIEYTKNVFR